jgi:Helix-turn-helix domain
MPRQDVSIMDQRREFLTLALKDGANRRELCRRFGISPQTAYKWLARFEAGDQPADDGGDRSLRHDGEEQGHVAVLFQQTKNGVRRQHLGWRTEVSAGDYGCRAVRSRPLFVSGRRPRTCARRSKSRSGADFRRLHISTGSKFRRARRRLALSVRGTG